MEKENKSFWSLLAIGLKLLFICAVVAGVVSFAYHLTYEPYMKNLRITKNEAVNRIFGKEDLDCLEAEEGLGVYTVSENGKLLGYCVEAAGNGFGGEIGVMVGYDSNFSVIGVGIVSHSETPGIGTKAMEASYLQSYEGCNGEEQLTLGIEVDAVSGATYSSKGILAGVNRANEKLNDAFARGVIE